MVCRGMGIQPVLATFALIERVTSCCQREPGLTPLYPVIDADRSTDQSPEQRIDDVICDFASH